MLELKIPEAEYYDESTNSFVQLPAATLRFEHSLLAISKWESKYEKPFLSNGEKTPKELLDYFQCMRLDDGPPRDLHRLPESSIKDLHRYMNLKYSATTFRDRPNGARSGEVVTSELMYYWLTVYQIPFECETWHLNRLMALIRICSIKNAPKKKMRRSEILAQNRALNEQRLAQMGTTG